MTRPSDVEAGLPGPLPLPGDPTAHDASAPVRPHPALWGGKKKQTKGAPMKGENYRATSARPCQRTAVVLVGAVLAVRLAVAVRVQLTDALPVAAAEGEL